jgi:hypothetical protein
MTLRRYPERDAERRRRRRLTFPWALALTTAAVFLIAMGALGGLGYATSIVSRLASSTRADSEPSPALREPSRSAPASVHRKKAAICRGGPRSASKAQPVRGRTPGHCRAVIRPKPRNAG